MRDVKIRHPLKLLYSGFVATALLFCTTSHADDEVYNFAVLGDTDYYGYPGLRDGVGTLQQLINEQLNQADIKFVVHVGDIKGAQSCTDSYLQSIRDTFETSTHPLLYTPGDNEWVDCAQQTPFDGLNLLLPLRDPLDALAKIRSLFFIEKDKGNHRSFGDGNIHPKRQGDMKDNPKTPFDESLYVENQMWERGNILYVIIHTTGSRDNAVIRTFTGPNFPYAYSYGNQVLVGSIASPPASFSNEKKLREAANLAWLDKAFDRAREAGSKGVVVLTQANLRYDLDNNDGSCRTSLTPANLATCKAYESYRIKLHDKSLSFNKPVLLVQGDSHIFTIQHPYIDVPLFTRVQGFGYQSVENGMPDTGWLNIAVNPANPALFTVTCGGVIGYNCPAPVLPSPDQ